MTKAILTPYQDYIWVWTFTYYLDEGKTDDEADKLAYEELVEMYPELRGYDKIAP